MEYRQSSIQQLFIYISMVDTLVECVTMVSGGVRRFKCCVISAPEGAFGRFQACVIYIGLGMNLKTVKHNEIHCER